MLRKTLVSYKNPERIKNWITINWANNNNNLKKCCSCLIKANTTGNTCARTKAHWLQVQLFSFSSCELTTERKQKKSNRIWQRERERGGKRLFRSAHMRHGGFGSCSGQHAIVYMWEGLKQLWATPLAEVKLHYQQLFWNLVVNPAVLPIYLTEPEM